MKSKISLALLTLALGFAAQLSFAQTGTPNPPAKAPSYQLKGVWAGVGYLDETKLRAKLAVMISDDEKKAFIATADRFLSAVAAYQFHDNGRYESDFEIAGSDGVIDRAATVGSFKILEAEGLKMVVEFVEKIADDKTETEKKLIQFYEDGDHLAILVPSAPELADCNPLIIFERVPDSELVSPEEIAREQSKSKNIK